MIKFTKMHGLGNDYVYIDAINQKIENESERERLLKIIRKALPENKFSYIFLRKTRYFSASGN